MIEDNGVGRKKAGEKLKAAAVDHQSMATKLTMERINTINYRRRNKISMHIEDLMDEQGMPLGTRVVFEFPVARA